MHWNFMLHPCFHSLMSRCKSKFGRLWQCPASQVFDDTPLKFSKSTEWSNGILCRSLESLWDKLIQYYWTSRCCDVEIHNRWPFVAVCEEAILRRLYHLKWFTSCTNHHMVSLILDSITNINKTWSFERCRILFQRQNHCPSQSSKLASCWFFIGGAYKLHFYYAKLFGKIWHDYAMILKAWIEVGSHHCGPARSTVHDVTRM